MILTAIEGTSVFVARASFDERGLPKGAGFFWHGGGCRVGCPACGAQLGKVWWTADPIRAAKLINFADEGARARLAKAIATKVQSQATDSDAVIPVPEGRAYLPFQRAGIAFTVEHPNVLIADEMGLGKTIQAIGAVNADETVKTWLVLCPKSLRLNWQREAERWLVRPMKTFVVTTSDAVIPPDAQLVICNYDKVREPAIHAQILARKWDALTCDEAHFLKNPKAQRTKLVLGHRGRKAEDQVTGVNSVCRRLLFLTGTPLLNKPAEIFPLANALAPGQFGSFFSFAKRYCGAQQKQVSRSKSVWDFTGATHLDELQDRLRSTIMVRRKKVDVLKDLPPKVRQVIELDANGAAGLIQEENDRFAEHENEIDALEVEADAAQEKGDEEAYKSAVRKLRERQQIAFAEISKMRHKIALAKVPKVIEHVRGMLDEGCEKLILFAHHHDVIAKFAAEFEDEGAVILTGQTPDAERQAAVDRFQSDPTCKVFIGSIQAAGVGLTLTAASVVVFAELDWVPANLSQAEDRAHRIGQLDSVLVLHLVFDGSLDARMAHKILLKQEIADSVLDRPTAPIAGRPEEPRERPERVARLSKYPRATEAQRKAAQEAMRILAGMCDGAVTEDGHGFNKLDTALGHRLAALPTFTDGQVWLASKLATKYQRQLPANVKAVLGIGSEERAHLQNAV